MVLERPHELIFTHNKLKIQPLLLQQEIIASTKPNTVREIFFSRIQQARFSIVKMETLYLYKYSTIHGKTICSDISTAIRFISEHCATKRHRLHNRNTLGVD